MTVYSLTGNARSPFSLNQHIIASGTFELFGPRPAGCFREYVPNPRGPNLRLTDEPHGPFQVQADKVSG